jgi:hypothetical protein
MAVVAAGLLAACACHRPASSTTDLAQKEDVIHAASGEARLDAIARKCARIASCAHAHDAPRVRDPGRCVDYWLEHMNDAEEPLPACLGAASSCADIDRCLHAPASEAAAKFCAAHPGMPTGCDGDTLVTCAKDDPTESTATPCHAVGGTCGETRGAGGLVSHACLSPVLCPPDVTRATCDENNSVVACHDQAIERTPCRAGTRCRAHKDADGEEIATCEGASDVSCDAVGERVCRGDRLGVCEVHGHHADEVTVDCSALGLSCATPGGHAACMPSAPDCAPGASRCEGSTLVFCASGRTERVPCAEVGLGACEAEGRGPVALCGAGRPQRRR